MSMRNEAMRSHPVGSRFLYHTDWKLWQKQIRHKVPTLLEVGRTPPKAVLSFGGAGFMVTYSLGVAMYLQKEKPKLLSESYLLGAGTGVLPAVALALGSEHVSLEKMRDDIIANRFKTWNEEKRIEAMRKACEEYLPDNCAKLMSGRVCIAIGMSMKDSGFYQQEPHMQIYGAQIPTFDDKKDVTELLITATAPNNNKPYEYRGVPAMRATSRSISSELDQHVRHVYIHGLGGNNLSQFKRHRVLVGRHGNLSNTQNYKKRQMQLAVYPFFGAEDALRQAFDDGFHDARRYERWEEDPYYFSKSDRSPGEDTDWREIRAAIFGDNPDKTEV